MDERLCIYSDGVYPYSTGGSHRYIYEISKIISRDYEQVTVCVPKLDKTIEITTPTQISLDVETNCRMKIERFDYNKVNPLRKFLSYLTNFRCSILANANRSDTAINVQYLPALTSILFDRGFPVSYFFHGPWSYEYYLNLKGRIKSGKNRVKFVMHFANILLLIFLFILECVSLRRARHYCVTTNYTKKLLCKYFLISSKKISIVGAGVDVTKFTPITKNSSDIMQLITLRRLEHRMGLELLLDACAILSSRRVNFKLRIAGKGPITAYLVEKIQYLGLKDHVNLVGFIPDEELSKFLSSGAVFVLPSIALEGFGLVILESLACNTPVVAFDAGGPSEVLKVISEKLLVRKMSAYSLADKLQELFKNKELLDQVDYRGIVARDFSWNDVATAFLKACNERVQG